MSLHTFVRRRIKKGMLVASIVLLLTLLLSACGADPQTQQQATQNKAELDNAIKAAQNIGVPNSMLQPILTQERQLTKTNAPLALFSAGSSTDYYTNLATRYHVLALQAQGLQTQASQQLDFQANSDVQTFGSLLAQRQSQGFASAKNYSGQLAQSQNQLAQATTPKQYMQVSQGARAASAALRLMPPANDEIKAYQDVITQLNKSHLDTTAMATQHTNDVQLFNQAKTSDDFQNVISLVNVQLQETASLSTQAIPYIGQAKLNQFSDNLALMKKYGMSTTTYDQHLTADRQAFAQARTMQDFLKVSARIDSDIAAIQFPLLKAQTNSALAQYHQMVKHWGDVHQFNDKFNGTTYRMGYEYDANGVGSDLDSAVQMAVTKDDYQSALDFINNITTNLKAMETNHNDSTPSSQTHATDTQLMQYYGAMKGETIVVSLEEQALRYYVNGKLVKAFLITSGQYDKPAVPGFWHLIDRESPTTFKSSEPKGSAFWYPDTKINFAMEYHDGGYFFHDSWWRVNYGPGTQFPHYDAGGDESFAGTGSHGCVNMPEDLAGWLYANTSYDTVAILY